MSAGSCRILGVPAGTFLFLLSFATAVSAQTGSRQFRPGMRVGLQDLPQSRLRTEIGRLPPAAQQRALSWLGSFHFPEHDAHSIRTDSDGGIIYVCNIETLPAVADSPSVSGASVPVNPFPSGLIFHSRPGSPNVLYLNFCGETVTNSQWNSVVGRSEIPALPFSSDSDTTTFNDAEQQAIKRIWQRVAEDYAPFDIDVTTERPANFNSRTAHALITRNTDANGDPNPHSTSGGVAYVNVFNSGNYPSYRPAWIYHNNLGNNESYIAEAASHEIGHNLGLSHDGKTDGTEYYGGHGSGEISWGPLMGTGYNRNVSQWSKGDYYKANNTQDDLATIAGKLSYRADDHGNTPGTSTPLTVVDGTNIVASTPENDPHNELPFNKGVFERASDVDVFSFVTGSGPVSLKVSPWLMPSGSRGGNLDVRVELYESDGTLVAVRDPANQTGTLLQTNLIAGRYYLHVKNSGTGDPFSSAPSGYTDYGSLGQYFITGYISDPSGLAIPPIAEYTPANLMQTGQSEILLAVTYSDESAIDASSIGSADIRVTGPNGYNQLAQLHSIDLPGDGTPRTATYSITAPGAETWSAAHNGLYTVWMEPNQVSDIEGSFVPSTSLGQFEVLIPVAIYSATMDTDPGWTLEPDWEYGVPNYVGGGPTSGFTGSSVIGFNLDGNYADRLSSKYATTPPINTSGSSSLVLRFQRWLRVRHNDTASIEVSTNGSSWIEIWSTSSGVFDNGWNAVQYVLPQSVAGSPSLRLRWRLSSNPAQNELGWHIDDVEIFGAGTIDTAPPNAVLSVNDVTSGGAPSQTGSVTYTDATAVRLSSLDVNDLIVMGPGGYSNKVDFVGADLPDDGSPVTGIYSIPAPGGTWDALDNGMYTLILAGGEVQDVLNNATPQTVLGTFNVSIPSSHQLDVTLTNGLIDIVVQAPVGEQIVLEASADLFNWIPVHTNQIPAEGGLHFSDVDAPSTGQRFYRTKRVFE